MQYSSPAYFVLRLHSPKASLPGVGIIAAGVGIIAGVATGAPLPAAAGGIAAGIIAGGTAVNPPAGVGGGVCAGVETGGVVAGGVVFDAAGLVAPGTGVELAGGLACVVGVTLGEQPVPNPTKQITLNPVMRVLTPCFP
jgi:hypothetical protein